MWNMLASLKAVGEGLSQGLTNALTVLLPLLVLMGLAFGAGWFGSGIADEQAELQEDLAEATEKIAQLERVVAVLRQPNSDTAHPDSTGTR